MRAIHPLPQNDALRRALGISGAALLALLPLWLWLIWRAPADVQQGAIQKILYLHPPLAFGAYLGFVCTALCGALYLWRRAEHWDRAARASAEVGVLLCTLMLLTGPIWAKGAWGRWWTWDLRLTLTLLLYLVYLSYLLLRAFNEGSERGARGGAVYSIAGLLVIPLNYFAIDLAGGRSMHPENLGRGSLDTGMGWPFLLGNLVVLACFAHLALRRFELAGLQAALARRRAGEAPWPT
ncbi:MAG: cytochrome c biogenesis protein CcsA [Deltaproteobacteria bacterium]|nr:cytochrome c biogenesis protein CcsA [Deltaproteobacteria bacterium]